MRVLVESLSDQILAHPLYVGRLPISGEHGGDLVPQPLVLWVVAIPWSAVVLGLVEVRQRWRICRRVNGFEQQPVSVPYLPQSYCFLPRRSSAIYVIRVVPQPVHMVPPHPGRPWIRALPHCSIPAWLSLLERGQIASRWASRTEMARFSRAGSAGSTIGRLQSMARNPSRISRSTASMVLPLSLPKQLMAGAKHSANSARWPMRGRKSLESHGRHGQTCASRAFAPEFPRCSRVASG